MENLKISGGRILNEEAVIEVGILFPNGAISSGIIGQRDQQNTPCQKKMLQGHLEEYGERQPDGHLSPQS